MQKPKRAEAPQAFELLKQGSLRMMGGQQLHGQRLENEGASRFVVLKKNDQIDSRIDNDINVQRRRKPTCGVQHNRGLRRCTPKHTLSLSSGRQWALGDYVQLEIADRKAQPCGDFDFFELFLEFV